MRNYPTPTPARKVQFKDDLNPFSSPITESKDKMCEELNASLAPKIPLKDSVCDDLSPSFAPEVESKDTACDDPNFAGKVQFQDAVYDHFNPSATPKDESEDTACDDLNSSLSPKVGQKKETSVDAPIPAVALKTGDKKLWSPCANPGNPIFSCMSEVPTPSYRPVPFVKPQNPLYKTTSAEYGSNQPTCEIAPSVYHPLTQSFSATLQNGGMYRNRSLNTGLDKNRVHDLLQY